jgi:hypothetical protein
MKPRRWYGWAMLDYEKRLHRITMENPAETESGRGLLVLGWEFVRVEINQVPEIAKA